MDGDSSNLILSHVGLAGTSGDVPSETAWNTSGGRFAVTRSDLSQLHRVPQAPGELSGSPTTKTVLP